MPTSTTTHKTKRAAGKRVAPRRAATSTQVVSAAPRKAVKKATAPAAATAASAVATTVAALRPAKVKDKLVRDSFTMPQSDFDLIAQLKERALGFKRPAKKSELLRAGLQVLQGLDDAFLRTALDALVPLKPGRPRMGS